MSEEFDAPDVIICPGGPMLVRGARAVQSVDGGIHPVTRPLVALCRCHKSRDLPWCDATHKLLAPDKRPV